MAIHGSLKTMPLSELLVWVQTNRRAGVITILRDDTEWELTVEGETLTGYVGPELRDNLGHIVVTSGMLTEEDLRVAYQYQRDNDCSLQRALLDKGMLTRHQIEECLLELATESIYDLFIELPGQFVFTEREAGGLDLGLELEERLPLSLDVNLLLMEGARRQDEWDHIRKRFPRDDITIQVIHDHLPPFEELGVRQRRILASLSAGQSLADICLEMRAPIPSVLRIIAEFEKIGAVEIVERPAHEPAAPRRVDELVEQARVLRDAEQYEEAIALLEVAVRMRPADEGVRTSLRDALHEQVQHLYRALPPVRVPAVVVDEDRIRQLRLRPEERFLLNRLSAHMDIGSLVMVSSMSERDTLKTLRRLLHSGVIELR